MGRNPDTLELVHEVLDQQIIDREKRNVGKVDGIVIELRENAAPRVHHLDVGTTVALRRVSNRLANWYDAIRKRRAHAPPFEIPWSKVGRVDITVQVDIDATKSEAYHFERWLRDHFIARIPGAHGKRKSREAKE